MFINEATIFNGDRMLRSIFPMQFTFTVAVDGLPYPEPKLQLAGGEQALTVTQPRPRQVLHRLQPLPPQLINRLA
jgi:hypothetical protein